ncbi:MAG TPA: DUF433 domain-containing protein [Longimicrobium sp.]|uniref:DUF433 domain-containing protein n=1 Tax=Longimicrobium sp. TaxID=2029185 RepID=UPI002ED8A97A
MTDLLQRIVINPAVRGGRAVVRGTRIAVSDVLEYLAGGMTQEQILADLPDLRADDIRAVLAFAAADGREIRHVTPEPDPGWNPSAPPAQTWRARFVATLSRVSAGGGVDALNWDDLFHGGVCTECGVALGARTREPLRFRHSSGQEAHYDGWSAAPEPLGAGLTLFSDTFLALLTDQEQALLQWRPAINTAYGKKQLFELAGSSVHLPLAKLKGGAPQDEPCPECGFIPPPSYHLPETLPDWLNPERWVNVSNGQPGVYLSSADLPDPLPPVFTIGDWRQSVSLVLPAPRWAAIRALPAKRRPRAVTGRDVAVVPPELVEA